ncbi:MAG: beta-Ala-His dipeptidase, partial [Gillisia sp.]
MNNKEIRNLEPTTLWNYFADLSRIPRPSCHEEKVVAYILDFAKKLGLQTYQDKKGNLLVRKNASSGLEGIKPVALQAHLDMVQQKRNDTIFDFGREPLKMFISEDWIRTKGTTLGADNGIGVAAILAVLSSTDLVHPPIEALFTLEEEVGATGAMAFPKEILAADVLLNLDSEDIHQLTIGCAGSLDVEFSGEFQPETPPPSWRGLKISIKGLTGGHSGVDIAKCRGNAIVLLVHILRMLSGEEIRIASLKGGGLRNAIPREATAKIVIRDTDWHLILSSIEEIVEGISKEIGNTDPGLVIMCEEILPSTLVLPMNFQQKLLAGVHEIPNGVYKRNTDLNNLVQASNNISK